MNAVAGNLCLGSAPDSWGVWFPADEHQVPYTRFLDELVTAGYTWLELGPYGYLPTDPRELADALGTRGLKVCGGTTFAALHRAEGWEQTVETVRRVAALTTAAGARHLVLIPEMFRDQKTGAYTDEPTLSGADWAALGTRTGELGRILAQDYDIRLCLHPHADSHVQTPAEIERFLDVTDPRWASLCLDTGHVAYGGGDTLDIIARFAERIGYVHLKQMDPDVLAQVHTERLAFGEAVRRGVCMEPPAGVPDPAAVVAALSTVDAELFVVVEQDLYPCAAEVPLPIATRTREYLAGRGLTGGAR